MSSSAGWTSNSAGGTRRWKRTGWVVEVSPYFCAKLQGFY